MTAAKKKKKKLTPIVKLLLLILAGLSVYFLYSAGNELMTTLRLQRQLSEVQERLQEVQDESAYLNKQKEKLQDPDYVQSYARGNYMLSKTGEQIFYLPENDNK